MKKLLSSTAILAVLAGPIASLLAQETTRLEEVVVTERSDSLLGIATSANEGVVGREQLALRPLLRPGETLRPCRA